MAKTPTKSAPAGGQPDAAPPEGGAPGTRDVVLPVNVILEGKLHAIGSTLTLTRAQFLELKTSGAIEGRWDDA